MYKVKRSDRTITIQHTREEYFAWLGSSPGGNVLALGANIQKYLPNTDKNERSFILTGKFLDER